MFNFTLYKREMTGSIKILIIFAAILSLYISMIINIYDPETVDMLEQFATTMPELMAAIGMDKAPADLTSFIASYLYGMILLFMPMIFIILRANGLIARYVDRGSMVTLVAAPVKRAAIAFTQMKVLASGIFLLVLYATVLELICSSVYPAGELDVPALLALNAGLLCLHFFIGGICFLSSCIFSDAKYSVGVGAGVPTAMFVFQMLANTGGSAEKMKYFTFFTLFKPDGIIAGESGAVAGIIILFAGAILLFTAGIIVFCKKDLHI